MSEKTIPLVEDHADDDELTLMAFRKPVDFAQFIDATRQPGRFWLLLNEPPPVPM